MKNIPVHPALLNLFLKMMEVIDGVKTFQIDEKPFKLVPMKDWIIKKYNNT